jgi:hypothetical protein
MHMGISPTCTVDKTIEVDMSNHVVVKEKRTLS